MVRYVLKEVIDHRKLQLGAGSQPHPRPVPIANAPAMDNNRRKQLFIYSSKSAVNICDAVCECDHPSQPRRLPNLGELPAS